MFKKSHRRKERRARRQSHKRSRGWSSIWRKRQRSITNGNDDATHSKRRLLPSLFYCFKKKKSGLERGHSRRHGRRGSGLLRLMSSFMKKKDNTEYTQWNHDSDEEDNGVPCNSNTLDSYVLTLGGIHILVEALYHVQDHTPAADTNAVGVSDNISTAAECHSSSTEPNPPATSQDIEEVASTTTSISSLSSTSEELEVSPDVTSLDWESSTSSLESLALSEKPSLHELLPIHQTQPEIRQSSSEEQNIGHQLVYEIESDLCKTESDDDTIFQMQQSIAKIERISHLICYPDNKRRSSMCIKQDNRVTSTITCSWQWITAVSVVFMLVLMI